MRRKCAVSGQEFEIQRADIEFCEKMNLPLPTLCPEERQRRRISYRNFRTLCYRTCAITGKRILSMYSEDASFPVCEHDYWWSDKWDARSYGREVDFSRPFFEQFKDLSDKVPRFGVMNTQSENCSFSNFTFGSKNCYLVFGCVKDEDCLYGHIVWESEKCVDCLYVYQSQWCSNSVDLANCYDAHFSTECVHCAESYFLHDCRGCTNCFCCTNLRKKQYCFFNKQLSRAEYEESLKDYFPLTAKKANELSLWLEDEKKNHCIYPALFSSQSEDVTGNHIYNSQDLRHCFDAKKSEGSSYCFTVLDVLNSRDMSFGSGRFSAEGVAVMDSEDTLSCHTVVGSNNMAYCEYCFSCHDLFGCEGLRRAEYCILNKQYTREEYFALREKLVSHMRKTGEWGEFFPIENSCFAYNESIVQEYFPLSKEQALAKGLRWKDEAGNEAAKSTLSSSPPSTVQEATEEVLEQTYLCEKTKKPYKIIAPEYDFCRRAGIPLPRVCPDVRHEERMAKRQVRRLWKRECAECAKGIDTAYSVKEFGKVFCEGCYLGVLEGEGEVLRKLTG